MYNDVDLNKLDSLASSGNLNAIQRQKDEMRNMLRKTGTLFSFVNEAKIDNIVDLLQKNRIGSVSLDKACQKIVYNYDKFPSFKIILELCKSSLNRSDKEKCDKCDSQGLVSLFSKSDGICYAFACSCNNGAFYPAFKRVTDINLNHFTRFAPTDPRSKNPYESFNARWQKYLQSMGKIP